MASKQRFTVVYTKANFPNHVEVKCVVNTTGNSKVLAVFGKYLSKYFAGF